MLFRSSHPLPSVVRPCGPPPGPLWTLKVSDSNPARLSGATPLISPRWSTFLRIPENRRACHPVAPPTTTRTSSRLPPLAQSHRVPCRRPTAQRSVNPSANQIPTVRSLRPASHLDPNRPGWGRASESRVRLIQDRGGAAESEADLGAGTQVTSASRAATAASSRRTSCEKKPGSSSTSLSA